jgi:hypothetical protein
MLRSLSSHRRRLVAIRPGTGPNAVSGSACSSSAILGGRGGRGDQDIIGYFELLARFQLI